MFSHGASGQPHLILLVGDEGILCLPHNVPGIATPFFADAADERARVLPALAARHPRMPVTLLSDTLAQDLRRDTLPRLNPFDRAKLVRRRLQQAFPQARLTASLPVKADRAQTLLAGLHGGPIFEWMARFASARPGNPPTIALLPVEGAGILEKLLPRARQDWALLVSRQRTGGFRQIVTHKGELVFTRLTQPVPLETPPSEVADTLARDIQASRGYLGRLGLSDRAALPAVLLLPENYHEAVHQTALPLHDPLLLSPHDAARMLDLTFAPAVDDPYSDVLFAGWFAQKKRPILSLMPPDLRQSRRTAATRQWGWRAAVAAIVLAVGMAGWDASDLAGTFLTRQEESARLDSLKHELVQERTAAAPATAPLGRLREALERQRLFGAPMPTPWAALRLLDQGIGDPAARLVKLDWQDETGKPADENLQVEARLIEQPDLTDREATAAKYRQMAQNVAQAMPGYTVDIARLPFPALPQEALSNGSPGEKKVAVTAELSIKRAMP